MRKQYYFLQFVLLFLIASCEITNQYPDKIVSEGITEDFPSAFRAVSLVEAGNYCEAKDILLTLDQSDFARKPRYELSGPNTMEVIEIPDIGNRRLLLARCHMELGEHEQAGILLWELVLDGCTTQELFLLFIREFRGSDYKKAMQKIVEIRENSSSNKALRLAEQYLIVAQALPDGDIHSAVQLIGSGSWKRDSDMGPQAEFKEWACGQFAALPQKTVPFLIEVMEANSQPTWIIYCLGICGDSRAVGPLEKTRERILNSHARAEIDVAITKIKKKQEERNKIVVNDNES